MRSPVESFTWTLVRFVFAYYCSLLVLCPLVCADWLLSPFNENIRVVPTNEYQAQNPPSFAWNRHTTNPSNYVIEITTFRGEANVGVDTDIIDRPQDIVYTFNTTRNWYLPTTAFPLGTYAWRVRPEPIAYTGGVAAWSDYRIFTLDGGALRWEVPELDVLRDRALKKKRPRALADDFKTVNDWDSVQTAAQTTALNLMVTTVQTNALIPFPTSTDFITNLKLSVNNVAVAFAQLVDCALLWRLKGDRWYLNEAFKRGDQVASLDPFGPTSYALQDQSARALAYYLIRGIDLLYDVIDPARKQRWLDCVVIRTNDLFADFSDDASSLELSPYDSHAATGLQFMTAISYLTVGETDQAEVWLNFCGRFLFHYIHIWSGADGGYANGTPYGEYEMGYSIDFWPVIASATGVNLFQKPWTIGYIKQFIYFTPPHSLTHVFGDASETAPVYWYHRSYAQRLVDPEAAWFAQQLTYYAFQEPGRSFLPAQFPMPYMSVIPKVPDNAIHMRSIGWTAMHSDITDQLRTSVYFRASPAPWGTYNHMKSNQNSFLLNSNGRRLLVECGEYGGGAQYGSPIYFAWYHSTRASNAITYDNGIGVNSFGNTINQYRTAKITHYSHTTELDSVEGDATVAYSNTYLGGDGQYHNDMSFTSVIRRLWYLRTENVVLVQDLIKSPQNHSYEWNFHALAAITLLNNGTNSSVMFTNVDTSLCITSLTNDGIQYSKRVFDLTHIDPNQPNYDSTSLFGVSNIFFHGAFIKPNATSTEFLMLLDVGCRRPTITIQDYTYERRIQIGQQVVTVRKQ